MELTIVKSTYGTFCVYLGDRRIGGNKPLGGGTTIMTFDVEPADLIAALDEQNALPMTDAARAGYQPNDG